MSKDPQGNSGPQTLKAVVIDDWVGNPKPGEKIRFESKLFCLTSGAPRFADGDPSGLCGVVVAIVFHRGGSLSVLGSGVIVAPGVAMAAKHVMNEYMSLLAAGEMSVAAMAITAGTVQTWRIRSATIVLECDVCLLALEAASLRPSDNIIRQASITTRLPALGERVMMCGYRAGAEWFTLAEDMALTFSVSSGLVTALYPERRDRVMHPYPCIEVDCPTLGGMSGGPVFDSRGHLFAMVTASFNVAAGEEPTPTYASLLWPVLNTKMQIEWPRGFCKEPRSLTQLGSPVCEIEGRDSVRQILDEEGRVISQLYDAWT